MASNNIEFALQITDLPEEILEYILLQLSPYRDFKNAMLVSRQWHRLVLGVIRQIHQNFSAGIIESHLDWTGIVPEVGSNITERYSHCACYYNKSMYIFGGCTSTNTTFNDLWRFDLKDRQWVRPLAIGTYPSPKACASMVVYKDSLVLFGGWSHPTPYPLHQAARFFSELHIYKPESNRWFHMNTMSPVGPAPTAGHSASIVGDKMVVFGGSHVPGTGNNEVWVFDFNDLTWQRKNTTNARPNPRYGQTQVTIDENHILVIGGCGGPNQIFNDLWLLSLDNDPWSWEEIKINQPEFSAPQLWCHPACKVGDKIVVLSKPTKPLSTTNRKETQEPGSYLCRKIWIPPREDAQAGPSNGNRQEGPVKRPVSESDDSSSADDEEGATHRSRNSPLEFKHPRDVLSNQAQQSQPRTSHVSMSPSRLHKHSYLTDQAGPSIQNSMQAFNTSDTRQGCPTRPVIGKNNEKRLEALRKFEERLRESLASQSNSTHQGKQRPKSNSNAHKITNRLRDQRSPMHLHVLDISDIVQSRTVTWQQIRENLSLEAPEETIFYSLVEGRGELIMFGGIQRDIQSMQRGMDVKSHIVSNNLYILSPPKLCL